MISAGASLRTMREQKPLVHQITNYVVMNETANATLALGALPVMAHAGEEVEEMTGDEYDVVVVGSGHAGKMGGAAGSGDDDMDAAFFSGGSVFKQLVGRAVGGDNARFMWNTEGLEGLRGEFHGVPVGTGTHDDADEGIVAAGADTIRWPV